MTLHFRSAGHNSARRLLLTLVAIVATAMPWPSLQGAGVRPPLFSEMVNVADYIVRVEVTASRSVFEEHEGTQQIYTYFSLEVLESIAGEPPDPLILKFLGGEIGDERVAIEGVPVLKVGEEHVLFVKGNGRYIYPLVAMMHGLYPVVRNQSNGEPVIHRSNGAPLGSTAQTSEAMHGESHHPHNTAAASLPPLTLEQFSAEIQAVRETQGRVHEDG